MRLASSLVGATLQPDRRQRACGRKARSHSIKRADRLNVSAILDATLHDIRRYTLRPKLRHIEQKLPGLALTEFRLLPIYYDAFRTMILHMSPDDVARLNGWRFHSDAIHLNSRGGMIAAEIFGPVARLIRVADYDEALALSNATSYVLCTGVDYHVPFGGTKASSLGPQEQGRGAVEFFTSLKISYVKVD